MRTFKNEIDKIGQTITNCAFCKKCQQEGGTKYDRSGGVIPRCLFFEERGDCDEIIIAIGQNPGKSKKAEHKGLAGVESYSLVKDFFNTNYKGHDFYKRATNLINGLDLNGHILWTELAKCEGKKITNETLAFCSSHYLINEIELAKKHFKKITIIALGSRTYKSLIFLFPKMKILGVPHPTGSFGKKFIGKFNGLRMKEFLKSSNIHQYFKYPKEEDI